MRDQGTIFMEEKRENRISGDVTSLARMGFTSLRVPGAFGLDSVYDGFGLTFSNQQQFSALHFNTR